MTVPLGEPIHHDGSASWDDRATGGGLESSWLKLELPGFVSAFYTNSPLKGVEFAIEHLAFGDLVQNPPADQTCSIVITRTATGGMAGTLDCSGSGGSTGPYHAQGTFSAEP